MASSVYPILSRAWQSTCKVLFGDEVGSLMDFEPWLKEYLLLPTKAKSSISGKEAILTTKNYFQSAAFASFDEIDFTKKFEPLNINEVKDIDRIVEACRERFFYTGNIILGKSSNVESSSNVIDSHFVLGSNVVSDSKYIGFCTEARYSEHCFGCYTAVSSSHSMKMGGGRFNRCFECHEGENLCDCYYTSGCQSCRDCLFSFGVKNGAQVIGNLPLPKDKYQSIKKKLVAEMAVELQSGKKLFSLLEIIEEAQKHGKSSLKISPEIAKNAPFKMEPVENAFASTTSIIFGKSLHGLEDYGAFLCKSVPQNIFLPSELSSRMVAVGGHLANVMAAYKITGRILDQAEIWQLGETGVGEKNLEGLRFDVEALARAFAPIAYACFDTDYGNNMNIKDATIMIDSTDCYTGSAFVKVKKCAYCHWPRESECIFGSNTIFNSSHCINCYYSINLARAFESDNCQNCADAYYLHNCENVRDSMFCFNVKNHRNSIGNFPLPQDKYKSIKSAVISQLASELEKKKGIKWSIYNIGAKQ